MSVRSPDGKNSIELVGVGEALAIRVRRGERDVVELLKYSVRLLEGGDLNGEAELKSVVGKRIDERFSLPWGKSKEVVCRGKLLTAKLLAAGNVEWEVDLAAFDDGVAFRYRLPEQPGRTTLGVAAEKGDVRFGGVPTVHYSALAGFDTDHEAEFHRDELTGVMGPLVDLPLLAVWSDGLAVGVTEARVRDFPNLYLAPSTNLDSDLFDLQLSPLTSRDDVRAVLQLPSASPWRVFLLADEAGKLLESNLLLCLNDAPRGDFDWVEPGKTTWHWWNGTFDHSPPRMPGMNLETHKRYIDFCAENGIAYHAVVADLRPWHVQSQASFGPGDDTDILTPRPELELPEILAYAQERGIGVRLWVHWQALEPRLEEAFAQYEAWGIRGLMIDFLNRDDQEMVNFCERVLESAARHKLHIQFHGSYKPSGEQRTFPHLLNREGVLNLEYLKWSKRCTPPHNVEAAYVRQLAGPLDYHSGGFRAISNARFEARNENPLVLGTRAHHLAMYVVYENPMPMVADTPEAYAGQMGFDFIRRVPVTWDETRFVLGKAGEYVVMARRKENTWYLGGMTDWCERQLNVPLRFLGSGEYTAQLYLDGSMKQDEPNAVRIETVPVTAEDALSIEMAVGGGFCAIIAPR